MLVSTVGAAINLTDRNLGFGIMMIGAVLIAVKLAQYMRKNRVNRYKRELERRRDTYGDLWRYREEDDKRRYDM